MALKYGGTGVGPGFRGIGNNWQVIQAGTAKMIPSGTWTLKLGKYCSYQEYDAANGIWRTPGGSTQGGVWYVNSDGNNFRVANQTGCVVGAYPTTAGSGYTSAPIITPSAGSSVFQAIVGGAVGATITIANGGFNYVYPPTVTFAAPPFPGLQASGYATITGGVVTSITVVDQGAGYSAGAPAIFIENDMRDTTGYGAQASCVTTGSGTLTGVVCTDFGNVIADFTAAPTLAFTGGGGNSAAATAIMCCCLKSFTITGAGVAMSATGATYVTAIGTGFPATASVLLNPSHQSLLVQTREARILPTVPGSSSGAGTITAVGTVQDGGIYAGVNAVAMAITQMATTVPSLTSPVFGGINDAYGIFPA